MCLIPSSSKGSVKAELVTFSRAAEVSYIALSYCWGAPTPLYQIQLNGQPFDVRPDLHDFLLYVRTGEDTT